MLIWLNDALVDAADAVGHHSLKRSLIASQCLESALELPGYEDHGVRGGLTEKERRLLRKSAA